MISVIQNTHTMRAVTRMLLKNVPRERLQKVVPFVKPIFSVLYRGNRFEDPISGIKYRKMLPYGRVISRDNVLAPDTFSLERHRLLWLFFQKRTNLFTDHLKVLHIAPEQCFLTKFRKMENLEYITADLSSPWADIHFDVHDIPFKDNYFDVIIANHLLEHVEDDHQVLEEFFRVMKPGGWGIFQVPQDYKREETYEDPSITSPEDRERHFWQDDHLRLYGLDYPKRLEKAGFRVRVNNFLESFTASERKRYALPTKELIYLCNKTPKLHVVQRNLDASISATG